jgi:hypothetical protein
MRVYARRMRRRGIPQYVFGVYAFVLKEYGQCGGMLAIDLQRDSGDR